MDLRTALIAGGKSVHGGRDGSSGMGGSGYGAYGSCGAAVAEKGRLETMTEHSISHPFTLFPPNIKVTDAKLLLE